MTAVPDEHELFAAVRELLASHGSAGVAITRETDLAADLSIDSVAAMDLVMAIEDRYDLDIPVNQLSDLRTVGDLVDLVRRQLAERQR